MPKRLQSGGVEANAFGKVVNFETNMVVHGDLLV
jgi:hypothetical protein